METSARTNKNVHWLFEELCEFIKFLVPKGYAMVATSTLFCGLR